MAKRIANTLSIAEILKMFSTEHKAVRWLEKVRWGGTPGMRPLRKRRENQQVQVQETYLLVRELPKAVHRQDRNRDARIEHQDQQVGGCHVLCSDRPQGNQRDAVE